jgi:hypothetical protein
MRFRAVIYSTIAIGVAFWTAACVNPVTTYTGPGCLIHIYTLPNLEGNGLPVVMDTPELATAWHNKAVSAKVIYGTWRLFSDSDYKGFMGDYKAPTDIVQLMPTRELGSLKCMAREPSPPRY